MQLTFDSTDELLDFVREANLDTSELRSFDGHVPKFIANKIAEWNYNHDSSIARPSKIMAIRLYRSMMGCSLKEAKEAIESTPFYLYPNP